MGSVADLRPGIPQYAVQSEAAKANARGLVITYHHTSPLGSNLSNWDAFWKHEGKTVPPLSVTNIENLKTFWRYHVETAQQPGFETVWTLTFRGSRDIPFWETFKDAPTNNEDRARVINQMLQAQADVVKEVTGNPAPNLLSIMRAERSWLPDSYINPPKRPLSGILSPRGATTFRRKICASSSRRPIA